MEVFLCLHKMSVCFVLTPVFRLSTSSAFFTSLHRSACASAPFVLRISRFLFIILSILLVFSLTFLSYFHDICHARTCTSHAGSASRSRRALKHRLCRSTNLIAHGRTTKSACACLKTAIHSVRQGLTLTMAHKRAMSPFFGTMMRGELAAVNSRGRDILCSNCVESVSRTEL